MPTITARLDRQTPISAPRSNQVSGGKCIASDPALRMFPFVVPGQPAGLDQPEESQERIDPAGTERVAQLHRPGFLLRGVSCSETGLAGHGLIAGDDRLLEIVFAERDST